MMKKVFLLFGSLLILLILAGCASTSNNIVFPTPVNDLSADNANFWKANTLTVWNQLQHTSLIKLQKILAQTTFPNNIAWLNLAIISKRDSNSSPALINHLITWRKTYPDHPANTLFPGNDQLLRLLNALPPSHIALLLPLTGELGKQGKIIRDGFLNAYYSSPIKNQYVQTISFFDTSTGKDVVDLYQQAIAQGAELIIGPLTKQDVQRVAQNSKSAIATLALNYTEGSLPSDFYEFGLSPNDEAQQAALKAYKIGRDRAIVIGPNSPWGQQTAAALIAQWLRLGGKITDTYYFTTKANFSNDIANLLHVDPKKDRQQMHGANNKDTLKLQRRQDFDVIFLIAPPVSARVIVPLLKFYYAGDVPIYATSAVYSSTPSPQKNMDLNGVHFPDVPWLLKNAPPSAAVPLPPQYNRLYAVGLDAYLLSHELPRLLGLPNFPLYAATGALTLNSNQHIYRRLPWTQMHAGHP